MNYKILLLNILIYSFSWGCFSQYEFSGNIDLQNWEGEIYLSIVQDYRKISGIYPEQIINKTSPDEFGYFKFSGNNLSLKNNIYRIHIDSCPEEVKGIAHFTGRCLNSKEVLFIANNTDTIALPITFDQEIFCTVSSNNEKSSAFIKIDSLKEVMSFDFGSYRSQANWDLNAKKWFKKFKEYGQQLDEPLAELYTYAFLSDRTTDIYTYYLKDLNTTDYYKQLLSRLKETYPEESYTKQYENEISADYYLINEPKESSWSTWHYILIVLLLLSLLANAYLLYTKEKKHTSSQSIANTPLTNQEQKILDLILDNKTNKEIASEIFVSVSTVKTHINSIYKKLHVSSRDQVKSLHKTA
ncbi:helix-turn-helix transcriptional regulator [Dokdonia sp.]|uniref:response regulator transcription factor n=1 Tax=Dokdonia sp. TaxID=2024995 RepID=UPI003263F7A7